MKEDVSILAKYYGGSHLYGLDTPESDLDIRGVFLYNDPLILVGYDKESPVVVQNAQDDISMKGFNDFIRLLAKGNTEAMECLYADYDKFLEVDKNFAHFVLNCPEKFLNTKNIFNCFRGYIQGEKRRAVGEITGLLGEKRKLALEKHGFSPRNFSHLLRLAFCGTYFFKNQDYPVCLEDYDKEIATLCFNIKTKPKNFTKEQLNLLVEKAEADFVDAYEKRAFDLVPDVEYIREVICIMNKIPAQRIISTCENYGIV